MMTDAPTVQQSSSSDVVARLAPYAAVPGRVLLASLFLVSGVQKIGAFEAIEGYMAAFGMPPALLPGVIAFELAAGLALLVGFGARIAALLLAGFSVVAAFTFHLDFADQFQTIMFTKNIAIAGGLLALAAAGPGPLSLDRRF